MFSRCTIGTRTPRNETLLEAVLKRARVTRRPWRMACDANMCPEDFKKSLWYEKSQKKVVALEKASTCRSKGSNGEWIEKVCDYVVACDSIQGRITQIEVVGDFECRPHKAVSFVVERGKESRSGKSKRCRRRFLATAEEDYQEEAGEKEEEKKTKKKTKINGIRKGA